MPRISNLTKYPYDYNVTDKDFVIGTDGDNKKTTNFPVVALAKYVRNFIDVLPNDVLPNDVLEYTNLTSFPKIGKSGKIYIAVDTNVIYRWSGTEYEEISISKQFVTDSIAEAIAGLQDNRLEFNEFSDFPAIGDETKFYIDLSEDKIYIWDSNSQTYKSQSWGYATVGSRSQQLSLSSVFRINQDGNANKIDVTAGVLFSQTLDETWNVSALVTTIPDNDYRYVYTKASKTTSTASIFLSKNQILFDSDVNDYYFLVGVLHSVTDGVRVLSITVGTTTISGGLIRTGIISSLDGLTSFNLNTGEIKGKITFSSGSNGYENLTDKPDLSSFEQTRDYVNSTLQTDLTDLKNRADGVIESWFYSHTPTLSNLPASNWVTTEERNAHIGDTFTNMQEFVDNVTTPDAGKAWRFVKNETTGEFSWSLIANSDSTKALIEAGKAKDTADAKRRVFVSQPYPPYNIGDLWVQGNGGDIMRCKFERLSGSYVATDFEKASKYTDDTAVNNLQIGGRNLFLDSKRERTYSNINPLSVATFDINTEYTISFDAKIVSGNPLFHVEFHGGIKAENFTLTNNYVRYSHTLNSNIEYGYLYFWLISSGEVSLKNIKVEKGNKATDWTPAPEDIQSQIDAESAKVINLENKTDFLTGTTIEGNAIATGTLLVGNSDGTNAGITGLGNTSDGVYLWGGGTYQQMIQGLAKKEQRRNGIDIWRHPNGQIGFEIGIKDGRLIFNGYHSSGFKLFELDPNRGLVNVSYTQESWTETPFRKLNYSSSTYDESTIANEIKGFLTKRVQRDYMSPPPYGLDSEFVTTTTYTVLQNAVGYDYDNGTNPANASYESFKGMKANYNDRYTNIANGWYMSDIGEIHMESEWNSYPPPPYTFTVYVYYYQGGKITQTKVVTVTK